MYNKTSKKVTFAQEQKALTIPSLIIAVSGAVKHDLIRDFGMSGASVVTVPNGVDIREFAPAEERSSDSPGPVVTYTGSFLKWKGVDTLVRAASLVDVATFDIAGDSAEITTTSSDWHVSTVYRTNAEFTACWIVTQSVTSCNMHP